ncbi:C39 family peptidase [Corallococcus sp. CA054B]|uniref:C39 family peptidase n=1 Tax=Corallococcus sp. CA054B TaxID=2316734 RepID=UPI0011C49B51|nr:C39 family peptidase [Corallococcus sp. CA054B]
MFSDGIRRALGPVLRTVANAAVEKGVAPPLQPAAKAVANFAVSSFERGTSPKVVLNPPPVVVQRPPVDLTPTPNVQGDQNMAPGEWLIVSSPENVYLRPGPSAESGQSVLFYKGTKLQVATPPDNGPAVRGDFVYVQDANRQKQGWVRMSHTAEMTEADTKTYRASRNQSDAADAYQGIYVNQFDAETQVGGDGRNANCGPTATLMAFLKQGLEIPSIPGITHNGTAGADVQAVRYWGNRLTDTNSDGVTTNPQGGTEYSLTTENSQYTGFQDVKNAVTAARGSWAKVDANSESIKEAIESGMSVVISGNFVEAPAQGSENTDPVVKSDTWAQGGGAQEHLVAVVGMTPEGNFIVCDPAAAVRTPLEVTPAELDAFMRGNAGAIGIYDPTPGPRSGA